MSEANERYVHIRDEKLTPPVTRALWRKDSEAFNAGAQYALDRMLVVLGRMTVGPMEFEHMAAADILERVQKRGPL